MGSVREAADKANDRPLHELPIPEWGCKAYVRMASAAETMPILERIQKYSESSKKDPYHLAWVVSKFLCEADGSLVYPGEDYRQLAERSFPVVGRLYKEVARLNGIAFSEEDEDEIEKKLETDENDSGSDYL